MVQFEQPEIGRDVVAGKTRGVNGVAKRGIFSVKKLGAQFDRARAAVKRMNASAETILGFQQSDRTPAAHQDTGGGQPRRTAADDDDFRSSHDRVPSQTP